MGTAWLIALAVFRLTTNLNLVGCSIEAGALCSGLIALQNLDGYDFKDRRLHRVERGKHPCDRARPRIGIIRQQSRMALGDITQSAVSRTGRDRLPRRSDLAERMQRQMRRFLHRTKRNQANLVGPVHFFKRQQTVYHASPLPPSGSRSKAVMVMVIVRLLVESHRLRGWLDDPVPCPVCPLSAQGGLAKRTPPVFRDNECGGLRASPNPPYRLPQQNAPSGLRAPSRRTGGPWRARHSRDRRDIPPARRTDRRGAAHPP